MSDSVCMGIMVWGLFVYFFAKSEKLQEVARLAFWSGLLGLLL